ncbi:MAG: response regulator [Nitrospirae bacterium]|nr:MAG: response regulator [Nitrospirota bacterium]
MASVLAVDDSPSIRLMLERTLANAGFEVTTATDGKDALAKAKSSRFELVLTDINMPEMDGFELIRELRKLNSYRFTPILTVTTESAMEQKQKGRAAGATGWIVKPFEPSQLLAVIHKVLGR